LDDFNMLFIAGEFCHDTRSLVVSSMAVYNTEIG
jgi:hypothetical protein